MHELAMAQSITEVVVKKARENQARQVNTVRLLIGDGSGVVTGPLTFCFEMIAGTEPLLTGARLEIERVPHRARCRVCATEYTIPDFVICCPNCGRWESEVISGTELQILDMEFEAENEQGVQLCQN
ncbi:MAG: hydrogenase maturation nickel metallochaperone HypA [Chloroflexi bacterium]|nr:hydrogenase maturation nickel metallochaperone HypA [Chloroflexota bacterium]OJW02761.1 MAG: hydrogenase maturation nickel metallochaperone HypA [Chloroflexi bacterium 54-19]